MNLVEQHILTVLAALAAGATEYALPRWSMGTSLKSLIKIRPSREK
jgi:hypothetical protein